MAVLAAAAATAAVLVGAAPAASAATIDPTGAAAQQLADRYAPVMQLRRYAGDCADTGEPFVPMTVDAVLGNPEVALRQVGNGDQVIRWAPTAQDLYGRGEGVYLDFAGEALNPGCVYAADSARYTPLSQAAVYGHVVQQADRPGYLAVQYWLYWYYNDWNNKHESDWEFVQVVFRAASVEEALAEGPLRVGYAQHTGGELVDWTSDRLERVGTHPVVYSSERSHASYLEPALFMGRSESEGFGCDNTQAPSTEVRPRVVLLPDVPAGPDDPAAWLAYDGRWGERQASPNNGPTGPSSKPRWTAPLDWEDGLRDSSFAVPGGSAAAPSIITAFCTVVGKGSVLFIQFAASPEKVLFVLAVLFALLGFLLRRTSWLRVPPLPVVVRRRAGEIVRAAWALYRRRPLTLAAVGGVAVPVGLLAVLISAVLTHLPFVAEPTEVTSEDAGGRLVIASAVGAALWPLTLLLVSAAVVVLLVDWEAPGPWRASARDALRAVRRQARPLASAFLPVTVVVWLLSITVLGLPFAVWLSVRFQFLAQAVMYEGLSGRRAAGRSSDLVRHRWLHTAALSTLVWAVVQGIGVLLGLLTLVAFTGLPLWSVSLVVVVCQVALVPLGALVLTLLYGDARAQYEQPTSEAEDWQVAPVPPARPRAGG